MPLARLRILAASALLILLLPIVAACGNEPPQGDQALPTANIATPSGVQATPAPADTVAPPPVTTPAEEPAEPTAAPAEPVAPTSAPVAEPGSPLRTPYLEFGVAAHLYYTDRERVLTLANIAGFDWIRQQVVWKDIEGPNPGEYAWGELDNIVNDMAAHKLKLLVSVVQSPSFYNPTHGLPPDPKTLGNFVEAMARRYGDKIGAYEIWNEQNLAHENGGRVTVADAGRYVELLAECYTRIKAVTPQAYVLAGPPSSTGFNREDVAIPDEDYYRAMYSYKNGMIKEYFDAQAVHPGGAANPPDTLFPDNPSRPEGCQPDPEHCWNDHPTHYFRHVENVRRFMIEEGMGDHQLWITEYGWATRNNSPGYEFGNLISLEQQADYITSAMRRVHDEYRDEQGRPWVGVMVLWNLNFAVLHGAEGRPEHEQASFGILSPDWSPRPSFLAIQSYLAQIKQERGR